MSERCGKCRRPIKNGEPYIFSRGWWYHYRHAPARVSVGTGRAIWGG